MLYLREPLPRLALKLFRGEPAISGFDWNFSPIHTSSPPFSTDVGSALHCLLRSFSLDMDRSPGFGSAPTDSGPIKTWFPTASHLRCLTLPVSAARRTVLQKVRGHTHTVLPQLVGTGFQVLFHSTLGSRGPLFTFPSQYYALSVTK